MSESAHKKALHTAYLLIAILLTILAVIAHRFLPERRLALDNSTGATNFLMHSGSDSQVRVQWVDQGHFHYTCEFDRGAADPGCSFTYLLYSTKADQGLDLSQFRTLNLAMRYD